MNEFIIPPIGLALGIVDRLVEKSAAKQKYKHQEKMKELEIIYDSNLRDQYVYQLLLDKFLAPIENAQITIQKTSQHAQYLAESLSYYYQDHQMNKEQSKVICSELRRIATHLTEAESLHNLKIIYAAITDFLDLTSDYLHEDRKYSINREIRKNILNPLNVCIGKYQNFQRRIECYQAWETLATPLLFGTGEITPTSPNAIDAPVDL